MCNKSESERAEVLQCDYDDENEWITDLFWLEYERPFMHHYLSLK